MLETSATEEGGIQARRRKAIVEHGRGMRETQAGDKDAKLTKLGTSKDTNKQKFKLRRP